MTTQEYLNQVVIMDEYVQSLVNRVSDLRLMLTSTGAHNDGERIQSSGSKEKMADMVGKIVDLERQIDRHTDGMYSTKQTIYKQIVALDDADVRMFLLLRYIYRETIGQIAEEMGKNERTIQRLHQKSLATFESAYGTQYVVLNA